MQAYSTQCLHLCVASTPQTCIHSSYTAYTCVAQHTTYIHTGTTHTYDTQIPVCIHQATWYVHARCLHVNTVPCFMSIHAYGPYTCIWHNTQIWTHEHIQCTHYMGRHMFMSIGISHVCAEISCSHAYA